MDKKEKFRLMAEDTREDEEFRRYVIENLAFTISRIMPGGDGRREPRVDPDAMKAAEAAEARQAATQQWSRDQSRNNTNGPRNPRPQ